MKLEKKNGNKNNFKQNAIQSEKLKDFVSFSKMKMFRDKLRLSNSKIPKIRSTFFG